MCVCAHVCLHMPVCVCVHVCLHMPVCVCVHVCPPHSSMAKGKGKGKKAAEPKGRKVTLKMARAALKVTVDGKRRLDLSNMGIAAFPRCILALSDVDELDLSRNLLRKLPDSISSFASLRWLDLHSNQLESLPPTIARLQKLHTLNLSNNRLTAAGLPPELGLLADLRRLNLGLNRLDSAPHFLCALRELRELALFGNLLSREPAHLRHLPKLLRLNMADNPLPPPSPPLDTVWRAPDLLLVRHSCLCDACHQRCHHMQERIHSRASAPRSHHSKAALTTATLSVPNAVPPHDQEAWR
ncbi:hypothetical protein ACEWY4_003543 [Coilia grayii]|uniref:Leucine rich repeat containing 18a n=1 Tax=Coilia grayii TaxID=363190 RepID=A0ABD1KRI5_9TELE